MDRAFPVLSPGARQSRFSNLIVVTCFLAATLGIASLSRGAPDLSTPKKAASAFAKAVMESDMAAVHQAAIGGEGQFAIIGGLSDIIAASKRFESACVKRFGDAGKLPQDMNQDLVAKVQACEEKIDGDKATLINPSEKNNKNPLTLKKDGDGWKVDLNQMQVPATGADLEKARTVFKAMVAAADAATKSVEGGKFKTAKEAHDAYGAAMMGAALSVPK